MSSGSGSAPAGSSQTQRLQRQGAQEFDFPEWDTWLYPERQTPTAPTPWLSPSASGSNAMAHKPDPEPPRKKIRAQPKWLCAPSQQAARLDPDVAEEELEQWETIVMQEEDCWALPRRTPR